MGVFEVAEPFCARIAVGHKEVAEWCISAAPHAYSGSEADVQGEKREPSPERAHTSAYSCDATPSLV